MQLSALLSPFEYGDFGKISYPPIFSYLPIFLSEILRIPPSYLKDSYKNFPATFESFKTAPASVSRPGMLRCRLKFPQCPKCPLSP